MNISKQEVWNKSELFEVGYKYLLDNFHKFSESNKIKIALEVYKKQLPTKMEHGFSGDEPYQRKLMEKLGLNKPDENRPTASE
jgi:hypothetical protein